jgi:hypothetical protein
VKLQQQNQKKGEILSNQKQISDKINYVVIKYFKYVFAMAAFSE